MVDREIRVGRPEGVLPVSLKRRPKPGTVEARHGRHVSAGPRDWPPVGGLLGVRRSTCCRPSRRRPPDAGPPASCRRSSCLGEAGLKRCWPVFREGCWRRRRSDSSTRRDPLSAAEGGCQAEIGVASAMAAALVATAPRRRHPRGRERRRMSRSNITWASPAHRVAGYVQIPVSSAAPSGPSKAWTADAIASN